MTCAKQAMHVSGCKPQGQAGLEWAEAENGPGLGHHSSLGVSRGATRALRTVLVQASNAGYPALTSHSRVGTAVFGPCFCQNHETMPQSDPHKHQLEIRLAAALRENLKRRKAQARGKAQADNQSESDLPETGSPEIEPNPSPAVTPG
jgi:hypothetical protein